MEKAYSGAVRPLSGQKGDDGHMSDHSDFLYARPSFWEGLARVLDLGGTLNVYNRTPTPKQADAIAIRNDWQAVGEDLRRSIEWAAQGSS